MTVSLFNRWKGEDVKEKKRKKLGRNRLTENVGRFISRSVEALNFVPPHPDQPTLMAVISLSLAHRLSRYRQLPGWSPGFPIFWGFFAHKESRNSSFILFSSYHERNRSRSFLMARIPGAAL